MVLHHHATHHLLVPHVGLGCLWAVQAGNARLLVMVRKLQGLKRVAKTSGSGRTLKGILFTKLKIKKESCSVSQSLPKGNEKTFWI